MVLARFAQALAPLWHQGWNGRYARPELRVPIYRDEHPLTDKGLKAFLDDWAKTGQSILPK